MAEEKKSGSGCLKAAGIGCAVVAVIGIIIGVVVVTQGKKLAKMGIAKGVSFTTKTVLQSTGLPQAEVDRAMVPINELSDKIRNDEISMEQVQRLTEAFTQGPVITMLYAVGFQFTLLGSSGLSPQEKADGEKTAQRFLRGVLDDKISGSEVERVIALYTEDTQGASGQQMPMPKGSIPDDEVRQVLQIMSEAADKAGVSSEPAPVDVAGIIERTIDQALGE